MDQNQVAFGANFVELIEIEPDLSVENKLDVSKVEDVKKV